MAEEEEPRDLKIAVAVLQEKVKLIARLMVTQAEFAPVKLIAYGIAALVISSVLAEVLSYVLRKG